MTERGPGGQGGDHLPEQFLVDGVAPSVIGEGPPESPFDAAPEPEPSGRHLGPAPRGGGPSYPERRQEPPTSPIPVLRPLEPQQEKRRSWLGRMFRG